MYWDNKHFDFDSLPYWLRHNQSQFQTATTGLSYSCHSLIWLHIIATVSSKRLLKACLPWSLPQLVTSQPQLSCPPSIPTTVGYITSTVSCPPFIPTTVGYITSTAVLPSFFITASVGYISASSSHCCRALPLSQPHGLGHS